MRFSLPNDWNWIVAGLAAALLVVGLTVIGNMPFLVATIIAAFVFTGLVFVLSPRKLFEGIDARTIGSGRVEFARDLLTEATPALDKLRVVAGHIRDKDIAARVRHLAQIATDVFAKVEANPGNASAVKRFLSYYLPQASQVAEAYDVLEDQNAPDPKRLDNVRSVIEKLETAFGHYADGLTESELGSLDTDLRLIESSLKEDLGH